MEKIRTNFQTLSFQPTIDLIYPTIETNESALKKIDSIIQSPHSM